MKFLEQIFLCIFMPRMSLLNNTTDLLICRPCPPRVGTQVSPDTSRPLPHRSWHTQDAISMLIMHSDSSPIPLYFDWEEVSKKMLIGHQLLFVNCPLEKRELLPKKSMLLPRSGNLKVSQQGRIETKDPNNCSLQADSDEDILIRVTECEARYE